MTTHTLGGRSTPPRIPLRRRPDFRRLWIGETTSSLGSGVTSIALPLVALTVLHAGVVAVSLLSAAAWLPWLLIGLPAGAWIDRLPRRPVMIAADAISLALFVSVPFAVWLNVLTMAHLLVVAVLAGTAKVFFATAYRAYLPALVPKRDLVEANSALQGSESAAQVVGPGLAGAMSQAFGAASALLLDATTFLASLICLCRVDTREGRIATARKNIRSEIADGARFVFRDPLLRVTTVFGSASNLVLTGYNAIVVVFLVRGIGLTPGIAGVLIAMGSLGGVAGAAVAPALVRKIGNARALLLTKLGAAPCGLLIPLTGGGWRLAFFAIGAFGLVGGIVAGNVIFGGFLQSYCPPDMFGRISSSVQVVNFGAIPLGALLGGLLADHVGFQPALWILFTGFALSSTTLLRAPLRGHRDLPSRALSQS